MDVKSVVSGEGGEPSIAAKNASKVTDWLRQIDEALKREKPYRKEGQELVDLFEGEKKKEYQFNILYSNTETMAPALYNSCPRPVVERRFKDADPIGKVASEVCQRSLQYLMDDGIAEYSSFDELMQSAVLEALVPGRGVTRFKYDATFSSQQPATTPGTPPPAPTLTSETVCGEEVPWNRFCHGYAKKWNQVPWVCYDHFMTREEVADNFGAALAALVDYTALQEDDDDSDSNDERKELGKQKVALIHEIWDKASRMVIFISPNYKDAPLKEVEDPLGLSGFFPQPRPLTLVPKISTLLPVPLYRLYEEQAKELNRITVRINKIISALKVRGFYDSTVEGLEKVLSADDNVLIPAENVAGLLAQGNALEKAIWLFPLEKLISVLQQLYLQRNQVKQVIYEITGIADIMRGSSQASETLGAQEIKNQWGTLRLKKAQKAVQRYARDCLRIMTEIAISKLGGDTLTAMTGMQLPTAQQKQQAQMIQQQLVAQQQPAPPELTKVLSTPSWAEVLQILKDDRLRSYRIDIETNSTVDAEATEDKENIGELLNALAQFLNGVQPLVEAGALPYEAAQSMMLAIVRRFQFGPELEDSLKMMKPPPPKEDPNAAKAQVEMQMLQLELQAKQQEAQTAAQQAAMEMDFKRQEHAMKMQELEQKGQLAAAQHNAKLEGLDAQRKANAQKSAQITKK